MADFMAGFLVYVHQAHLVGFALPGWELHALPQVGMEGARAGLWTPQAQPTRNEANEPV